MAGLGWEAKSLYPRQGLIKKESESLPCLPSGSPYPEPGPEDSCASTKSHQEELRFPFYPV